MVEAIGCSYGTVTNRDGKSRSADFRDRVG